MARTKKMDESSFAQLVKEFHAVGELIRARQDEKQAIMDGFDSESKRFFFGKISEKALASSVQKTSKELQKLDAEIRSAIKKASAIGAQAQSFAQKQSPNAFKVTLSGIKAAASKKKKTVKKAAKKKAVKIIPKKVAKKVKKKVVKKAAMKPMKKKATKKVKKKK